MANTNQYLSFYLEDELYATDILCVREVLEYTDATPVPNMPNWVRGVYNLRGTVIPIVDLRSKFGMGKTPETIDTCILVVETSIDDEVGTLGILIDAVQEVLEFSEEQLQQAPKLGTKLNTDYIQGMGKTENGIVILINLDMVLSAENLEGLPKSFFKEAELLSKED